MLPKNGPAKPDRESGQALVEFAFVLMFVILPIMFVLIDGAVTLYTQAALTNVAREGARSGAVFQATGVGGGSFASQVAAVDSARTTYIRQEVQRMIGPLVSFPSCNTTITYLPATPQLGNPFRQMDSLMVSLACPRRLFFGLIGTSQITLTAQSTMRIEPGGVAPSP